MVTVTSDPDARQEAHRFFSESGRLSPRRTLGCELRVHAFARLVSNPAPSSPSRLVAEEVEQERAR